ncbi:RING-14 protein-like protein [Amniculicola lignicola CBS 123094]|uniref:RING-14 protein-like protein n=1 Tax=Amniculicola lignicola CBS 123094 TaxID=1392246 RepID=A0A6A5VWS8_9PLEO|nr:RING-14 protein-like protein [Amniculicola lignicola CBS 123094]
MKFGHVFKETLKNEGFPPAWVESAISYSQLKKCINRLTTELAAVGLTPTTLGALLKHVEDYNAATAVEDEPRPFEYILSEQPGPGSDALAHGRAARKPFHPKLLFHVSEATGELLSATLDEDTRKKLQMLAVESGISDRRVFEEPDADRKSLACHETTHVPRPGNGAPRQRPGCRTVEIPLTSDSEFFAKLAAELSGLEALQARERRDMHTQIEALGKQVAKLTDPDHRSNRKILAVWRQIFQAYVESGIFFGTTEQDHTAHDADKATVRFHEFANKIASTGLVDKLKKPENVRALNTFMNINREILQGLRFGEINRMAMMKILKKFDKQTALGVKASFPAKIEYPEFSEHLAKAVCAEVNTQILAHVPQIDDYSCPMCMDLKWRPVKLRCGHTFCIRCLIVMQNEKQHKCPLCREPTVVDANSDNLDLALAEFLKKWFPDEVKAKQKYNERMAGIDEYGEVYDGKCMVM